MVAKAVKDINKSVESERKDQFNNYTRHPLLSFS